MACLATSTVDEPAFDRIASLAASLFNAPMALVSVVAGDRQWFKASFGMEGTAPGLLEAFGTRALLESGPTVIRHPSVRFFCGAPLRSSEGLPLGALCVMDECDRPDPPPALLNGLMDLAFLAVAQLEFRSASAAEQRARTQRQQVQDKLEEAQRLAHLGYWELDLATEAIIWSDETYRLFGLPLHSPVSYGLYQSLLVQPDRSTVMDAVNQCIQTGTPYCVTHSIQRPDGIILHLEGQGRVEYDAEGRPAKLLGTVLDVTARVQADILLRQSNYELERRVQQRTELLAQSNAALLDEIEKHKLTQSIIAGQNQILRSIAMGEPTSEIFGMLLQDSGLGNDGRFHAAILIKDEAGDGLRWAAGSPLPEEMRAALPETKIGPGNGTAAEAAYFRKPVVKRNLDSSSWRSLASTPILDNNNEVLGTVSFACRGDEPTTYELRVQEVCAGLAAIALLRDKEQATLRQWEQMFQHASWGMALADARTGKLLLTNPAYVALLGYQEWELVGLSVFNLLDFRPDGKSHLSYESVLTRRDGAQLPVWIDIVAIFDRHQQPLYWAANVRDITQQKAAHEELQEALRQYSFLADNAPQIFWTAKADGGGNYFNHNWYSYTGLSYAETEGWGWTKAVHSDDLPSCVDAWTHTLTTGAKFETEFRVKRASDGMYRWQLSRAVPFRNPAGEIIKWFGTCTDIHERKTLTDRLETEVSERTKELRLSLNEKETLLKEIHHRVKNNLQVISSLLRMQGATLKDQAAISALKESQQRVMSMALIHERLYSSRDMHEIDFGEYARILVAEIFRSYATIAAGIVMQVEAPHIRLNIDQAIPCGLILNELVSNALKYSYPNGSGGGVMVSIEAPAAGMVRLSVSDQGAGLPPDWTLASATSLGLPIVDLLAKQIGGELRIKSGKGSAFTVEFSREASPERVLAAVAAS